MLHYLYHKFTHLVTVLLVVTLLAFLLVHLSGDPATLLAPLDAKAEDVARVRQLYGLDQPLYRQYFSFLGRALQGNLGQSYKYGTDSAALVLGRLPATVALTIAATLLSVIMGIPLGIHSATRQGSVIDTLVAVACFLAISIPSFFMGLMLILLFAGKWHILPPSGRGTWQHLILPMLTLSAYSTGLLTRLVRSTMLDVLRQDYIRTARAKGLGQRVVLYRHALRNCLIPTITVVGLQFGSLLGGAVVVESVFAWPGVGWLMLQAIQTRDIPLVRTTVLMVGILFVLINMIVDLSYAYVDPRISYKE